jgi:hypothetical protein
MFKRDAAPKRRGKRQNGRSRLSDMAKTPSRSTTILNSRALSRKPGQGVPAAIVDHLVIIGWTIKDGESRKVQASFDSAGEFSCRLYDSCDDKSGLKRGKAAAVTIDEVELVPKFLGKTDDEVICEVQKFLENKLGLPADFGEV